MNKRVIRNYLIGILAVAVVSATLVGVDDTLKLFQGLIDIIKGVV